MSERVFFDKMIREVFSQVRVCGKTTDFYLSISIPSWGRRGKKETEPEKTTLCFPAQDRKIIRIFFKVEFHTPVIQRRSRYMRH